MSNEDVTARALELFAWVREGAQYFSYDVNRATLDGYIMATFEALGLPDISEGLRATFNELDAELV